MASFRARQKARRRIEFAVLILAIYWRIGSSYRRLTRVRSSPSHLGPGRVIARSYADIAACIGTPRPWLLGSLTTRFNTSCTSCHLTRTQSYPLFPCNTCFRFMTIILLYIFIQLGISAQCSTYTPTNRHPKHPGSQPTNANNTQSKPILRSAPVILKIIHPSAKHIPTPSYSSLYSSPRTTSPRNHSPYRLHPSDDPV